MTDYRALISVPIRAASDDDAEAQAAGYAQLLTHRSGAAAGHVELLAEVEPGTMHPARIVHEALGFRGQIPITLI